MQRFLNHHEAEQTLTDSEGECLPHNNNFCTDVTKYKQNRRERFLTDLELKKLEEALTQQEKERPSSGLMVNAVRLLLYTGYRVSEIFNLTWENVHLKNRVICLSDSKAGESVRPLNQKAIDLLASMKSKEENPYVFYGKVPGKPLTQINTTWKEILKRADIKDFRLADLRHSYAVFALRGGTDLYAVSKLLGYKNSLTSMLCGDLELDRLKGATEQASSVFS